MIFAEEHARWLLVAHTIAAGALVGAATHLVVWMRGFVRGDFRRVHAVRKFAVISAGLYVLTLVIGNLVYPVYKVRVRVEYLEQPAAVTRDSEGRLEARARAQRGHQALMSDGAGDAPAPPDARVTDQAADLPRQTAKVARWFDVKEHWVALGAALAIGCAVILLVWNPRRHDRAIAPLVFLLALGAALAAWLGAVIGIVVSSYRAVGALGGVLGGGG